MYRISKNDFREPCNIDYEKCQYCKALFFIWWSILENIGENDSMVLIDIKMEDIKMKLKNKLAGYLEWIKTE